MSAPRWTRALLRVAAPKDRMDDVLGDHDEAHARRVARGGRVAAHLRTAADALDMSVALLRERWRRRRSGGRRGAGLERQTMRRTGRGPIVSWLDFKLGLRMLLRYPGLTIVGGLAIAFAIWVGAGTFELMSQFFAPQLPLPAGERIVGVRLLDVQSRGVEPQAIHDMVVWREEAATLEQMGAWRTQRRNLIIGEAPGAPASVAEMSASGFTVAGVPPLLGRTLTREDERPGAADVVVIGYDLWQSRFQGDSDVVGRTLRLGRTQATVVGVMPEGFGFPIAHELWTPLRLNPLEYERRQGPGIQVFARLVPGATMEEAKAELAAIGLRNATAWPDTHERLRVEVLSHAFSAMNLPPNSMREIMLVMFSSNLFLFALLAVICSNVALLIFARAAAREPELVVRTALGASRRRIVGQLFVEALILGSVGALVGLAAAGAGIEWALGAVRSQVGDIPFWFRGGLSPTTVLYAVVLTVAGAAIAGVMPAFKVTRGVGDQLRQAGAGGGGLRFGGIWTAVIVTQVAVTVAFPAVTYLVHASSQQIETLDVGFVTEEYLTARVEMDREPPPDAPQDTTAAAFMARYASVLQEMEERLAADPRVVDVTFADRLPRMYHPWNQIEVDEGALDPPDARGHRMGVANVDAAYFDVLGTSLVSGRGFASGDVDADPYPVVVNESFVRDVLGGKNPVGRRVRFVANESSREPNLEGPWHEIVGVVEDMGTTSGYGTSGIYRPISAAGQYPLHLAIRMRGDPMTFAPQLQAAANAVDPGVRLHSVIRMDDTIADDVRFYEFWFVLSAVVSGLALLLSLAGIYSVMSFTVARRTREIGIRVALGSHPSRVAAAIFRRPLAQIAGGIVIGTVFAAALSRVVVVGDETVLAGGFWPKGLLVVAAYSMVMTAVCLVACVVPLRRALSVEPTDALRAEG